MKARNLLPAVLLLISVISVLALSPLSNAQQTPNLSITPSTTQLTAAKVGTTIIVNLAVSNVQNLYAWNLNLTWNPQILNFTQIQEGPFFTDAGQTFFPWDPASSLISRSEGYLQGVADVSLTSSGVNGNGVLATISFEVLSTGTSTISIDGSSMKSPSSIPNGVAQNITATITNGVVTVGASNVTPTPTPISTTPTSATSTSPTSQAIENPTQNPTPTAPEFPTFIILPLILIIATALSGVLKKTKINTRQ